MGKLRKNIFYNIMYRIITILIPLITAPYLSRVLGPEKMGIFSYTNAFAYYFFLFSMLGVTMYGNREIAINRDSKEKLSTTFWQIYYIQFFLSIIMFVLYILFIFLFKKENKLIWYIQSLYVISAVTDINWFAFGLEKFKLTTIRSILIKLLTAISYFIFVHDIDDLWIYTLIVQLGNIISLLVVWPLVIKNTNYELPKRNVIFQNLTKDILLFLPLIASSLYMYMDKIMLGDMANEREVGFYQYAENIINIPNTLIIAIGTALLPHVSKMVSEDKQSENLNLLNSSIKYLTILTIGMTFGVFSISKLFIPLYLGKQYLQSAELLCILSIILIFNGITEMVRTQYLIPRKMDKCYLISIVFGAIVNVILNLVLIPNYKSMGATIATVSSYLVVFIIQCYFSRNDVRYSLLFVEIIPYFIFGIVMVIILNSFDKAGIENKILLLFIKVTLGIFTYGVLSLLWMCLVKKELKIKGIRRR